MADINVKFKVFGKQGCDVCHKVQEKMEYFRSHWLNDAVVDYYDMETVEGLTEGAFNDVSDVPTVILERGGKVLGRWDKTAPTFEELKIILKIPSEKAIK